MSRKRNVGRLEQVLRTGRENATSAQHLIRVLGVKNKRALQKIAEIERNNQALICSAHDERGCYWLAKDRQEAREYYEKAAAKAKKILYNLRHIKKYAEGVDGQEELAVEADDNA